MGKSRSVATAKTRLSVYFSDEVLDRLELLAQQEGTSPNKLIVSLLSRLCHPNFEQLAKSEDRSLESMLDVLIDRSAKATQQEEGIGEESGSSLADAVHDRIKALADREGLSAEMLSALLLRTLCQPDFERLAESEQRSLDSMLTVLIDRAMQALQQNDSVTAPLSIESESLESGDA
ncbi:MAG: hypothetical protein AAGF24_03265 [Cyanobacteria bacterium P01_H01_bin.121]